MMLKKFVFIFVLFPFISKAQNNKLTCAEIKKGVFHFYPKNLSNHFLIIREDDIAHEIDLATGDTSVWEIKWTDDCVYSTKFISGSQKKDDNTLSFLKRHKFVFDVLNITDDYYVFKGYTDKISDLPIMSDTIWFNEKATVVNHELFKQVPNSVGKPVINDTSKYALLYVYRPGKITNSLGNYIIYFDDNVMCAAKNNTGYLFKIFKEGNFGIKSKLYKDESSVNVNIKFGKIYYAKSMIHWGLYKLYNFKLEMENVDAATGESDIEKVKLK